MSTGLPSVAAINYDGQQLCGVADHLGSVACQWQFLDVLIHADGVIGGVSMAAAMQVACDRWNEVCGLRLKMTNDPAQAHIIVMRAQIDGAGRVLADSELPCGFTAGQWRRLKQRYDTSEAWVLSDNPPSNKIDAGRVFTHELGHAIGIGHISGGNLMAPTYSSSILRPMNGDVMEARARYGAPAPINPSPPVDPPGVGVPSYRVVINGVTWEFTGKRVA